MRNYVKKYVASCLLFFMLVMIAGSFNSIFYKYKLNLTATAFDPAGLPADAKPASGFAWSDTVGWINFGTSTDQVPGRVYVSNNKLYGYAWGENIGWISMNCDNDLSCGSSNYGVTQDTSNGILTGYAWGENIGWINFAPTNGGATTTTNYEGVNTLSGYVWGENIGWISLSGTAQDSSPYGVSTTWTKPYGITVHTCTYTYSDWGTCNGGQQNRTATPDYSYCSNQADEPLVQTCSTATTTVATTTPITISLTPTTANLHAGDSVAFTATVIGTTSDVVWSVKEGAVAGGLSAISNSSALFTASSTVGTYHIIAKVENEPSKSASSTVTINKKEVKLPVGITIDPKEITVETNQGVLFKSFITNTENENTTWVVAEEGGGTINDTGLYTAPNYVGTFHVIAKAQADTTKTDMAKVIVRLPTNDTSTTTATSTSTTTDNGGGNGDGDGDDGDDNDNGSGGGTGGGSNGGTSGGTIQDKNFLSVINISNIVTNNVAVLGTTTQKVVLEVKKLAESPAGSAVTNTITTAGVVGGGIAVTSVFVMNGAVVADLLFLPFRLWALLLSALGLKKKRPWGTVYDSVTKQPIDPAYVTLKKIGSKEENTSITDLDGRYGFLVTPGKYRLTANKTNYIFPSKKMAGKDTDTIYNNLYFGGEMNILTASALINKNIPLDPLKFDWNEFVKGKKKLMKFYSKRERLIRAVTDWLFRIGFVISLISLFLVTAPYNFIIFVLYIVLAIFRKFGGRQKATGSLLEKNGNPLSFAIIRVFSPDLDVEISNKVASQTGRYYCLVPKGKYYVKIDKKNDDESYTTIFTSKAFNADNGIISKDFTV